MNYYEIEELGPDDDGVWFILGYANVDSTRTFLHQWNPRGSGQRFLDALTEQVKHGSQPPDEIELNAAVRLNFRLSADLPQITLDIPAASTYVHLPITLQLTNFIRDLAAIIDE